MVTIKKVELSDDLKSALPLLQEVIDVINNNFLQLDYWKKIDCESDKREYIKEAEEKGIIEKSVSLI